MCDVNSKDFHKCSTCENCKLDINLEDETCSRTCLVDSVEVDKDFSCKHYKQKSCSIEREPRMLFSNSFKDDYGYVSKYI